MKNWFFRRSLSQVKRANFPYLGLIWCGRNRFTGAMSVGAPLGTAMGINSGRSRRAPVFLDESWYHYMQFRIELVYPVSNGYLIRDLLPTYR
jgi:hypothetical protein